MLTLSLIVAVAVLPSVRSHPNLWSPYTPTRLPHVRTINILGTKYRITRLDFFMRIRAMYFIRTASAFNLDFYFHFGHHFSFREASTVPAAKLPKSDLSPQP